MSAESKAYVDSVVWMKVACEAASGLKERKKTDPHPAGVNAGGGIK